jgi:SAM-dependent methyltransferase
MSSEAYGAFAYAYDKGLGERFFAAARRVLTGVLEKYPTAKRTHLDLACGTGLALEHFRKKGWKSTGLDASLDMLALARKRGSRLVAADLRAIPLRRRFARITCLYDSLNHMTEREDLVAAFRAVRGVMDHDSLFLFDMNHPDVYRAVWGMSEPFVAEGHDYRLEIATSYRSRERIAHAVVTGWALIGGEKVEIRETHTQRAYSENEIEKALAEGGLATVEVIDFDPYGEIDDLDAEGVKLFFVCRAA